MNRLLLGKDIKDIVNHIVFGYITELDYEDGYYLERCLKDFEDNLESEKEEDWNLKVDELEGEIFDLESEVVRLERILEVNEIEY